MTLLIPNVAQARSDYTSATITMQDVSATGVISDDMSGAKTITAAIKTIEPTSENELEDTSASTTLNQNNAQLSAGTSYAITGLVFKNDVSGTRTNLIFGLLYDTGMVYVKLVYTRAGALITYRGIVRNYNETNAGKGQLNFSLNLAMIDTGQPNPSVA